MRQVIGFAVVSLTSAFVASTASAAVLIASDDFETGTIAYGSTTGTGLGPYVDLEGAGGIFAQTGGAAIDGARSQGIFTGTPGEGGARALTNTAPLLVPATNVARFEWSARHNVNNSVAFTGVNVKANVGGSFGAAELISMGMTPGSGNNSVFVGAGTNQTIALGTELRGQVLDYFIQFSTVTGAYTAGAKLRASPTFTTVSGTLKTAPGTFVPGALGFGNFNSGSFQDLILDSVRVTAIPEPATLGLLAGVSLLALRRR